MEKVVKKRGRPKQVKEVKGGKIQEIIESRQAPSMRMGESKPQWKPGMPPPDEPLDWSERRCKGGKLRSDSL